MDCTKSILTSNPTYSLGCESSDVDRCHHVLVVPLSSGCSNGASIATISIFNALYNFLRNRSIRPNNSSPVCRLPCNNNIFDGGLLLWWGWCCCGGGGGGGIDFFIGLGRIDVSLLCRHDAVILPTVAALPSMVHNKSPPKSCSV